MVSISLCMIVRDEEDVLARCLDSVQGLVDEIIIVDTGSSDRTKEIAARYTQQVLDFAWVDDFAAARNYSFAQATKQYILWLDADDVLEGENYARFQELKQTLVPTVSVVMMQYHTSFDEQGKPLFTYYRERLLKNEIGLRWEGAIHEAITPFGKTQHAEIAISHRKTKPGDPDRNLRIFEKMIAEGRQLSPREQFYYARELYYHQRMAEAAVAFETFLAEPLGWLENRLDACRQLAYCYYALEREEEALAALLRSLAFDAPRAEHCCDLGRHFFDRGRYQQAIFWYEAALRCPRNDQSGAFVQPDCYDYIPYLQLCLCYDKLGQKKLAQQFNERAGEIKPDSAAVAYNKRYFSSI